MKLRELFTQGETIPEKFLDHEVSICRAMDAELVLDDTLRYWNGKDTWPAFSLERGGVLVVPRNNQLGDERIANVVVFSDDAKASFMRAMRMLHAVHTDLMNTPIYRYHSIGDGSHIHACVEFTGAIKVGYNSVLGGIGFGFTDGLRNPHIGGVRIEDGVEIGSNTCIDRGTLGNTVIGAQTKIGNLVHIAHNAYVGKNCQIVCQAGIGGSAIIGDNVFVGFGAKVMNKVRVGDGAIIGMGAVVIRDVPAGATVVGNPARILPKAKTT